MMRKRIYTSYAVIVFSFLLLFGCQQKASEGAVPPVKFPSNFQELSALTRWTPDRIPMISAHRGGPMADFPENCIATFENSLKHGALIMECDVRHTRDGQLVLMHDETVDRTTTGSGKVETLSLKELRQLKLIAPSGQVTHYTIPTLHEVLEWARGKAILSLDVKNVPAELIVEAIRKHDAAGYAMVICYTMNAANYFYRLMPELMISVSGSDEIGINKILTGSIPLQNLICFVGVREPEPRLYQMLHKNGIMAILGTMGNLDRRAKNRGAQVYTSLLKNGADILATDNVPLAAQGIRQFLSER
jgi:glycerophosphoryl diester phosphodiesterase